MTTTTFINGTVIEPAWLNDVNALTYSTTGTGNTVKATAPTITSPTISSGNLIVSTGKVGIGTASPAVSLAISGTDAALIPSGTTAQRPTGATGYIRFNSTTTAFEGYNGTSWNPFNGTVTSVAASVPAFLSISGSPITTTGTLAISYSGTALPAANGGTGLTTITANNVLLGNGTSALQTVAPGTSANLLTSNGTTWVSSASTAIGVGQTWQDVTSSRANATTYTNLTGRSIFVSVLINLATNQSQDLKVNGVVADAASTGTNIVINVMLKAVVPPGATYILSGGLNGLWTELR